jgi:AraC-like DNA-binding protein
VLDKGCTCSTRAGLRLLTTHGMSERTLARRLAEEGVTFVEVLQQLKATLARHYLEEKAMPISKIAWLLGFEEPSSFSHAFKRWTGKSPRELRAVELAFS